jgi:glycosyltransferase involved in cell wall biosynthesis
MMQTHNKHRASRRQHLLCKCIIFLGNRAARPCHDDRQPVSSADVSVLLPYRDAAATVEEALDCMLAQRGVGVEVVAVDDGSRDDGPTRVARLAARHRRLRCLGTPGVGIAAALNLALAAAEAPVVARMDGDDVCAPERLALQLEALRAQPRVAALGTQVSAFPDDAVAGGLRAFIAWQNGLLSPADHARQLFVESPLCHPSVMMRREALAAVGGYRAGPFPEDYDLWLRLDAAGWALAKLASVLVGWRHRAGRATFADPRCSLDAFRAVKAPHLAQRVRALAAGRAVVVWGAGKTGKRLARALDAYDVRAAAFIDIDPKKLGGTARGAPVRSADTLARDAHIVVVAVGARGARDEVRGRLDEMGFVEGADYLCAS